MENILVSTTLEQRQLGQDLLEEIDQVHPDFARIRILIEADASLIEQDQDGETALTRAAARGHEHIVKLLLAKGVPVDQRNGNGKTALMRAVINGYYNVTQVLLQAKADPELQDDRGRTVIAEAISRDDPNLLDLFLARKVKVNYKFFSGDTPVIWAIKHNKPVCACKLIEYGADLLLRDKRGKLPLHYVQEKISGRWSFGYYQKQVRIYEELHSLLTERERQQRENIQGRIEHMKQGAPIRQKMNASVVIHVKKEVPPWRKKSL